MITREEIEKEYKVEDGIILSFGKFEREPIYAPYFYGLSRFQNPDYIDNTASITAMCIDEIDRAKFPEIPTEAKAVSIYESEQGLVYCRTHEINVDELRQQLNAMYAKEFSDNDETVEE